VPVFYVAMQHLSEWRRKGKTSSRPKPEILSSDSGEGKGNSNLPG
jgi:hypothetical protein